MVWIHKMRQCTLLGSPGTSKTLNVDKKQDDTKLLSNVLVVLVRSFATYRFVYLLIQFFLELDPFSFPLRELNEKFQFHSLTLFVIYTIQFVYLWINGFEILATLSLIVLLLLAMLRSVYAALLQESERPFATTPKKINVWIKTHLEAQLALREFATFQELGTLFLMLIGLVVFLVANFVTIKLYDSLPFPVYAFFVSLSFVVALIVNLTLPLAHGLIEVSTELKRIWGASLVGQDGIEAKCVRRRLKGVKPIRIWAGLGSSRMFCLNKETKVQYFEQVIDNTVNVLLSAPATKIK